MKKTLYLDNSEKERILEMHRSAIRKTFLIEQDDKEEDQYGSGDETKKPTTQPTAPNTPNINQKRDKNIKTILSKNLVYTFTDSKGIVRKTLQIPIKDIKVITKDGLPTARVYGILGQEGSTETDADGLEYIEHGQYTNQVIFDYDCRKRKWIVISVPALNKNYRYGQNDSTQKKGKGDKPKELHINEKDEYEQAEFANYLINNLFLCGERNYTPITK